MAEQERNPMWSPEIGESPDPVGALVEFTELADMLDSLSTVESANLSELDKELVRRSLQNALAALRHATVMLDTGLLQKTGRSVAKLDARFPELAHELGQLKTTLGERGTTLKELTPEKPDNAQNQTMRPEKKTHQRTAEELKNLRIPASEYEIDTSRSGGKGGQNVNKVETKAWLRFPIGKSRTFSEEEKQAIRAHLGNDINENDELVLWAQDERTQGQNKDLVVEKLHEWIREALAPEKERIATKPSGSAKRERLAEKRREGEKKAARREKPRLEGY